MTDGNTGRSDPSFLWVDPADIELVFAGRNPRDFIRTAAPVMEGDWDVPRETRFHEIDVYRALQACLVSDTPWKKTDFYKRVVSTIQKGTPKWGCTTVEEFHQRLARLELLYAQIRDGGYKTQRELGSDDPAEEILVAIRRDGRFLFLDGRHRLAIARLLGLPHVPVFVITRHKEWERYKAQLRQAARGKSTSAPIKHPDLAGMRT